MPSTKPPTSEPLIFASCLTYELGKRLGVEGAAREFQRQCEQPKKGDLPAARMILRMRQLGPVAVYHAAGTCLPKVRSRCASEALRSGADFWVLCDDDVECDTQTLTRLIKLAATGCVAVLPCLVRGDDDELQHKVNVVLHGDAHMLTGYDSSWWRHVSLGGCGLMVVPRSVLQELNERYRDELAWLDDDGSLRTALFEMLREPFGGSWFGEDFSFCRRVEKAGIPLKAPVTGTSSHDGQVLDLDVLRMHETPA